MRSHPPPSSRLLVAAWIGMLALGCRSSQVWFGRAADAVQSSQGGRAADSGRDASASSLGDAGENDAAPAGAGRSEPGAVEPMPDAGAAGTAAPSGLNPLPMPAAMGGAGAGGAGGAAAPVLASPRLPSATSVCPQFVSGNAMFAGYMTKLWVGTRVPGQSAPLLIYWHGTGSSPSEAESLDGTALDDIMVEGGVVAAPAKSTGRGEAVGTGTWTTGDVALADEIVACAIERQVIDPRRVYTAGCSDGGLMAGNTVYVRSSYIAAAMLDSGGSVLELELEDPAHVPAVIAAHGAAGEDVVIVDFAMISEDFVMKLAQRGGYAVVCDHGGGHCATPPAMRAAQWRLLKDHPFGTKPSPYVNGLPSDFPASCLPVVAP